MPTILYQRLDYSKPWSLPDVYLFTANPIRNKQGALVMGRGAALAVKTSYPEVPYQIKANAPVSWYCIDQSKRQWIGAFLVKSHWRKPAELPIIYRSVERLLSCAKQQSSYRFHVNAPGVGNGKLQWDDVEPLLASLPDNVIIYL